MYTNEKICSQNRFQFREQRQSMIMSLKKKKTNAYKCVQIYNYKFERIILDSVIIYIFLIL